MESTFEFNSRNTVPPGLARPGPGASGYMLSSMELRAGLDVRAISAAKLPLELLRELLRLQASWSKAPAAGKKVAPSRPA